MMLSTYADDTIILCTKREPQLAIQTTESFLKYITDWATSWCITLNPNKTIHVLFTKRSVANLTGNKSPKMKGILIKNEPKHRYLGLILDRKLLLHHHINQLKNRIRNVAAGLNWIIGTKSKLSPQSKILLYKQIIAPVWQYALPLWGALTSNTQFQRIEAAQSKLIRKILKAGRYTRNQVLRDAYNIKSINEIYSEASNRLATSLASHPNTEARKILMDPVTPNRLEMPRYLDQLNRFFLPLRQQLQQQNQLNTHQPALPTLISYEQQLLSQQASIKARQQDEEREQNKRLKIEQDPHYRPSIGWVNAMSYKLRHGITTRWEMADKIKYEPEYIQRLIMPPLLPSEIPPPTPDQELDARLSTLKTQIINDLDLNLNYETNLAEGDSRTRFLPNSSSPILQAPLIPCINLVEDHPLGNPAIADIWKSTPEIETTSDLVSITTSQMAITTEPDAMTQQRPANSRAATAH